MTPRLDGGGVEQVTLETARFIRAAGGRSFVASAGGALEPQLAEAGAELVRLPVDRRSPLALDAMANGLIRAVRRHQIALIHVRSRAPAFAALWAGRVTDVPVVATYHGVYASGSPLKRWYNRVMTRGALTIANSAFTRDHVLAEHRPDPQRLVVVPEGIDTHRFDPAAIDPARGAAARRALGLAADDGRRILLLPARLTGWKGQATAICALARLGRGDVVLVLAGPARRPQDAASLRAAAHAQGVGAQVVIPGAVEDMPAALAAADIVLAPSTSAESFGRSVAEACAMGALTLASDLGGAAEVIVAGETGVLVPPGDVEAWAAAIAAALAAGPEARAEIGRRARERIVSGFSLEAMAAGTLAVYRRLLGLDT